MLTSTASTTVVKDTHTLAARRATGGRRLRTVVISNILGEKYTAEKINLSLFTFKLKKSTWSVMAFNNMWVQNLIMIGVKCGNWITYYKIFEFFMSAINNPNIVLCEVRHLCWVQQSMCLLSVNYRRVSLCVFQSSALLLSAKEVKSVCEVGV